ncbi:FkbM family methyltransferase [Aquisphaera insulae]|uniref:FkbM family methyltransferase n=1 Tax=Aquisphaera insulae TaxID=2712864 RepID=UPI0013EDE1BD|nr:FkbM family methyltransferase [Aquisphaera insulae]
MVNIVRRVGQTSRATIRRVLEGRLPGRGPRFTSHIGQDAWVAGCLRFRRGGFFLDFGAFDGKTISNTHYLEQGLGWRGICVEPNPRYFPSVCRSRASIAVNAALWPRSREVLRFADAHGLSSIESFMDLDATADLRRRATHAMIEVDTINPTELLRRFEAPQLIDYLSLDVEGAEYEVLSALDLGAYSIALMTIEHNHVLARQEKIRAFLATYGYEVVQNRNDDFFFHRDHLARLADGHGALPDPIDVFRDVHGSYREPRLD